MRFDCKNCIIVIDDGKGKVYQNGRLMFKGDSYIAIKFMLQFTDNAEEVREFFHPQLSMREQVKWKKNDDEVQRKERERIREEREKLNQAKQKKTPIRTKRQDKMKMLFK
tara:strand:+ start:311 stop:640 length:330 start_codon:yes stop_codon:yes gene_type:complete